MTFESINEQVQRANQQARFFVSDSLTLDAALNLADFQASESERQAAASAASSHRLVKATKCPTQELKAQNGKLNFEFKCQMQAKVRRGLAPVLSDKFSELDTESGEIRPQFVRCINYDLHQDRLSAIEIEGTKCNLADWAINGKAVPLENRQRENGAGRFAVITRREWSGEFRIRTQVEQPHKKPPPQDDIRATKSLSMRGAVAIADSCHYMAEKHNGYSTFLTLTFDAEARSRLERRVSVGPSTSIKLVNKSKSKLFLTMGNQTVFAGGVVSRANKKLGRETIRADGVCTKLAWQWKKIPAYEPVQTFEHDGVGYTDTTLQKEVSRFFDAAQKMYQRGWTAKTPLGTLNMPASNLVARTNDNFEITAVNESIKYCWVAENPKNTKTGKDNPHVHVLMDWRVDYGKEGVIFKAWAARLEGIWGQGFANLEKIRDPQVAGAYMAKAAGYMTKASGASDQGEIYGNRYAISEDARAPEWEIFGRFSLDSMGYLIRDVHDYFSHKYGNDFKERKALNTELDEIKEAQKQDKTIALKNRRKSVGEKLQAVRAKLNELPAIAGKYQLLIKGQDKFNAFLQWAVHGNRNSEGDWLPEIAKDFKWDSNPDNKPDSLWYSELKRRRKTFKYGQWLGNAFDIYTNCIESTKSVFSVNQYNEYAAMNVAIKPQQNWTI